MKINAVGESFGTTGFAVAFARHVKGLEAVADVECFQFGQALVREADCGYFHGPSDKVASCRKHSCNVGYLVCESSVLNQAYFKAATAVDEIWTCSQYCAGVLAQLNKPVKVIPHYAETFSTAFSNNENPKFLVAFNADSRVLRKNPVRAIEAIRLACPKADVVVKCYNLQPSLEGWIRREGAGLNLTFVKHKLTSQQLYELYVGCDILVSLHSAEGFGLHLLEAMALGKCVVGSAWGGNLEFMNEGNSFLVECNEVDSDDNYFLGTWGYPKLDSSVAAVKAAVDKWQDFDFAKTVVQSVKNFSSEACVEQTKAALYE